MSKPKKARIQRYSGVAVNKSAGPTLTRTKSLLAAALKVWELKQRDGMRMTR